MNRAPVRRPPRPPSPWQGGRTIREFLDERDRRIELEGAKLDLLGQHQRHSMFVVLGEL
jgi:hypothetical protein